MGPTVTGIWVSHMVFGWTTGVITESVPTHVGNGVHFEHQKQWVAYEGSIPLIFFVPGPPKGQSLHRGYKWTNFKNQGHAGPCDYMAGLQPFLDDAFHMKEMLEKAMFNATDPMFRYTNSTANPRIKRSWIGSWLLCV